jgi:hypothetical protein
VVAAVTVTELDEESLPGEYAATFRPTSVGRWQVKVDPVAPNPHELPPWREPVEVISLVQFDPVSYLAGVSVELTSPVAASGAVSLYQGDAYQAAESRTLAWNLPATPNLLGAAVTLTISVHGVTVTSVASVSNAGESTQTVAASLTPEQTASLPPRIGTFDLAAILSNGHPVTLGRGRVYVTADVP